MTRRNNRLPNTAVLNQMTKQELIQLLYRISGKSHHHREKKSKKALDWSKFIVRRVAFRISYFGERYRGLAIQATTDETVEEYFYRALERAKLIQSRESCRFSRCGRTDKGVSALENVVALDVRANPDESEPFDYMQIMNNCLPEDIRVTGFAFVSDDFNARYHCLSRTYKYLFFLDDLDIEVMRSAAQKLVGTHDFRNFCTMNVVSCSSFTRTLLSITIDPVDHFDERPGPDTLYAITVKGHSFLYNQVRCMVACLFLIGRRLEGASVIDALLDVGNNPCKPQYELANQIPLILTRCEFDLDFDVHIKPGTKDDMIRVLQEQWRQPRMIAALRERFLCRASLGQIGGQLRRRQRQHMKLLMRSVCPSLDDRLERLNDNQRSKMNKRLELAQAYRQKCEQAEQFSDNLLQC